MTTLINSSNSSNSSLKSFHSALSTPDTSTFGDTLVDSVIIQQLPLTKANLTEHLKNSDTDIVEYQDVRMMQYVDWQQFLIEEQKMKEREVSQENIRQQMRNSIWGIRKSTMNRVGYHGNHLGYHFYYQSHNNEIKHSRITKLKRMFGRITVPFRSAYKKDTTTSVRYYMYDDKNIMKKCNSNSDNRSSGAELIAIGYDEWV